MTEEAWRRRFPKVPLEESQIKFKTYTGEALEIIGQAVVEETYQDKTTKLPLQILKRERTKPIWKELAKEHSVKLVIHQEDKLWFTIYIACYLDINQYSRMS